MVGIGVAAQTLAGNPKRHTRRKAVYECGPTTQNRSTLARPKAAGNNRKHPMHTGAVETTQHTATNSPKCNTTISMRLHPDTRERSNQGSAPTTTREAPGKPQRPKGNTAHSLCQPQSYTRHRQQEKTPTCARSVGRMWGYRGTNNSNTTRTAP